MRNKAAPILETILGHLRRTRGAWAEVSKGSGVPYHTLTKIAQGKVANPRMTTVQMLVDYFDKSTERNEMPTSLRLEPRGSE